MSLSASDYGDFTRIMALYKLYYLLACLLAYLLNRYIWFCEKKVISAEHTALLHFTGIPSVFEVILQSTCYVNYLLTYLLTYCS